MHMTDRGLLALVRHEGLVPGPYLDVKQVWTFGIGHTAAAGPPDPATSGGARCPETRPRSRSGRQPPPAVHASTDDERESFGTSGFGAFSPRWHPYRRPSRDASPDVT